MIANYHTHTWRCNHASGKEEEYVTSAMERGLKVLGFSDHSPYPFPWYHFSWFRMKKDQLAGYVSTVEKLRDAYRDSIEIHTGLEAEYYPAYFSELLALLKDSGVEYLLLGQHYLDNEIGAHYSGNKTGDEALLRRYCHQTMDAMNTGMFTYFAHPDLINFAGDSQVYERYMRQLCREARSCGVPLELNLLGVEKGRHYPGRRFWELAAEEGNSVILGCDSHSAAALRDTASEQQAIALAGELGITLLETVELRKIP